MAVAASVPCPSGAASWLGGRGLALACVGARLELVKERARVSILISERGSDDLAAGLRRLVEKLKCRGRLVGVPAEMVGQTRGDSRAPLHVKPSTYFPIHPVPNLSLNRIREWAKVIADREIGRSVLQKIAEYRDERNPLAEGEDVMVSSRLYDERPRVALAAAAIRNLSAGLSRIHGIKLSFSLE